MYPVNSPHKGPVPRKMFPFDDVIMIPKLCTCFMLGCALWWIATNGFCSYLSWLLHWQHGKHMIVPVSVKRPWKICENKLKDSAKKTQFNHNKHSTTHPVHMLCGILYIIWFISSLFKMVAITLASFSRQKNIRGSDFGGEPNSPPAII